MIATKGWVKNLLSKVLKKTVNNYSLEEQRIGTWIDGKPLYQKTIISSMPQVSGNGFIELAIDIKDLFIDTCLNSSGFFLSNNGISLPINGMVLANDIATSCTAYYSKTKNSIVMHCNNSLWNDRTAYITIQYTKTTDTATN